MTDGSNKRPDVKFSQSDPALELSERLKRFAQDAQALADLIAAGKRPLTIDANAGADAFRILNEALNAHPDNLAGVQADLANRMIAVMQDMSARPDGQPDDKNAAFSTSSWQGNPLFDFMGRAHAAMSDWALTLPETTPGLSDKERDSIRFHMRQSLAMMAPANALSANPGALNAMFATNGESLCQGLDNLKSDYDPVSGYINISQSDPQAFTLGESLAATPGEVIFSNTLIELIRYFPTTEQVHERPILVFPPWINKFYVLDLQAHNSLVAWLRDQGFTVYMVSWRNADDATCDFNGDDYLNLGGLTALAHVYDIHKTPVNAVGYCIGGTMLSAMAAYLCGEGDDRLSSITLMAAQTDFSAPGDLGVVTTPKFIQDLESAIADNYGVMPGELMAAGFNMLRPDSLIWPYVQRNYLMGRKPRPLDMLYWNADQTNIPGPLHLSYLRACYLENAFSTGQLTLNGKQVSIGDITLPAFVHGAERDHISPYTSVYRGAKQMSGDTQFLLSESGHIAGAVNPPSSGKYGYWTTENIAADTGQQWRDAATHHPGSWWPVWNEWLTMRSGQMTSPPARMPDAPPAPGKYVRVTLADIKAARQAPLQP